MTFDVFPGINELPTIQQVKRLCVEKLHVFLASLGLESRPTVSATFWSFLTRECVPVDPDDKFVWHDGYLWFEVDDVKGGTDVYCVSWEPAELAVNLEELESETRARVLSPTVTLGTHWYVRRSAGQPAVVEALYGFLASALAELTRGVVVSTDGAWSMPQFHLYPADFDREYLRPEKARSDQERRWAEQIQAGLLEEFGE
ncbi:hypothetical protein E7T09_12695 [Deinococcus sp. KSM4-11]|uniref:hypothetical protein n=1 Tax=Deinococcus sp. KSM4-11 TaxID=2568654 RepID=UPI0010A39A5E|nr:hypothetical protein [Deinococcus sp. KSM4-11]THF86089.1 hypothetical protein E7T09_12695 [Deinococcus sp. KSM4-11]